MRSFKIFGLKVTQDDLSILYRFDEDPIIIRGHLGSKSHVLWYVLII